MQSDTMREIYWNCLLALAAEDTTDCDLGVLPQVFAQVSSENLTSDNEDEIMRIWPVRWHSRHGVGPFKNESCPLGRYVSHPLARCGNATRIRICDPSRSAGRT